MRWTLALLVLSLVGCDESTPDTDAGPTPDSGSMTVDAGPAADAGPASDAGAAPDTGPAVDSGAEADAGVGSDAGPAAGTAGCGMSSSLATGEWLAQTLSVGGVDRDWFLWLPDGYDPARAYPVVYQFHGCSDNPARENNNPPVQNESGADAIHVRGRAVDRCWDTGASGPDVAFFDALVAEIEASYCADPDRRFATGYSSGAFMSHRLACIRGDVLRGVATIGGGQGGNGCSGTVAALLIHDSSDGVVNISASEGARDAHVSRNGCASTRTAVTPSPCEAYDGCDAGLPVVWCETSGMGHSRQDGLAAPAFWGFLSAL